MTTLSLFLCAVALFSAICESTEFEDTIVQTLSGPVRGKTTPQARYFLGIPFAQPPVGSLRWRDPQPPTAWSAPLDATKYGFGCPQVCMSDCLIGNILYDIYCD
jgi:para-nitrobenzyl esterase